MAFNKSNTLNLIQKYVQRGQIDKAIKELEGLVDVEPNDASVHIKIGDLYLRNGKKVEAKDEYNKAANIYLKDGFNNRAIATYKMVSRLEPTDIEVNMHIAELFEKQGLVGDAVQQYKYVANIYDKQKNHPELLNVLKKILNLDPDNTAAKIKVVDSYLKSDEKEKAYKVLSEVSADLKQKKMYSELTKALEMFLDMFPKDKFLLREVAGAYVALGNPEEGLKKIQSAQKLEPNDPETLLILAETYLSLNKYNDAESIYCGILRNAPSNYCAKFGLSKVFLKRDNVDEAVKELAPFYSEFEEHGELNALADFYNEVLKKLPANIEALEKLGEIYRYYNNTAKIVEVYERLALAYDSKQQVEKADFLYQKILQINPEHDKAKSYLERDNNELLAGAFKEKSTTVNQEVLNEHITEANVYLKFGLYDQAKEHLDYVLKEAPDNIDAHVALKDIYLAQNQKKLAVDELFYLSELSMAVNKNKEEGIRFLNEVINIDPTNQEANERLKNVGGALSQKPKEKREEIEAPERKAVEQFDGIELVVEEPEELKQKKIQPAYSETSKELQKKLEEAEFYFKEGFFEDAKKIYKKILLEDPYNSIALERLGEQTEQKGALSKEDEIAPQGGKVDEQLFDFTKELEEAFTEEMLKPQAPAPPTDDRYETENIFSQFKKGLEERIDSKDYDSHYNLGIAYKEMGLLSDSIDEFKKALVAEPGKIFECGTMLGLVALETKKYDDAIKYFEKILAEVELPAEKKIGLRYELATAYQESGKPDEALKNLNIIKEADPNFRNVKQKIQLILDMTKEKVIEKPIQIEKEEEKRILAPKKSKVSYV